MSGRWSRLRSTHRCALVAVVLAAVAIGYSASSLPMVFANAGLPGIIDVTIGVVALMGAVLVELRYRRTRAPTDLAIVVALGFFALQSVLPRLLLTFGLDLDADRFDQYTMWASVLLLTMGSVTLWITASSDRSRNDAVPLSHRHVVLKIGIGFAVALLTPALLFDQLPQPATPSSNQPQPIGPFDAAGWPFAIGATLVGLSFGIAAIVLAKRADDDTDEFFFRIAVAAIVAATAALAFAVHPALSHSFVHIGDLVRAAALILVLRAAAIEALRIWQDDARAAALDERAQLARDLHDGLAQELAFIRSVGGSLRTRPLDPLRVEALSDAAERAYLESRRLIDVFAPRGQSAVALSIRELRDLVVGEVQHVTARAGVQLALAEGPGPMVVADGAAVDLPALAREAATNAVRHGHAVNLRLALWPDPKRLFVLEDDGVGLPPKPRDGHGIRGMRARAKRLGTALEFRSAPSGGTVLELRYQ